MRRHTKPKKKKRQSESDVDVVTKSIQEMVIENKTDNLSKSDSDTVETINHSDGKTSVSSESECFVLASECCFCEL